MSEQVRGEVIPAKLELLMQLMNYQTEYSNALIQAERYKNSGDLDAAKQWYEKFSTAAKLHVQLSHLHNKHYDPPFDVIGTVNTLLNGMSMRADVLQSLGNLTGAEEVRLEMLDMSEHYLSEYGQEEVKRGQAGALISQGRFNEALITLAAARDYFQREGDKVRLARTTLDMVDLLQWLGDFRRARAELTRASNVIAPKLSGREPNTSDIFSSVMDSLAGIMSGTGDGSKAQQSVELYRIATELNYYQGLISKGLSDFETAEQYFHKVLPRYQQMGVGPAIEYQFASIKVGRGQYREGLDYAQRLEPIFLQGGLLRPKLAALLKVQGEALIQLGRPDDALDKLRSGIRDLDTYYDPDLLWRLQWQEGRALQMIDKEGEALDAYVRAGQTINNLRKSPLGYRLDSAYLADKLELFTTAIDLSVQCKQGEQCAEFMELLKSRTLTVTMSVPANEAVGHSVPSELEKKFDELSLQLDTLEYQGYKEGHSKTSEKKKEVLLAERASVLERIRFSDPRWRALTAPAPFNLRETQKILGNRGQTALTLFYQKGKVDAVLITDEGVDVESVILDTELEERLEQYVKNFQLLRPDPLLHDPSRGLAIGARHLIPERIFSKGIKNSSLIIVPHGPLHLIPWSGLIYRGKRLFEYTPVCIVPNLSCILNLSGDFSAKPNVTIFGPPDYRDLRDLISLTGAEQEVDTIKKIYKKQGRFTEPLVSGADATAESFWRLFGSDYGEEGILHIACHGKIETIEPMNSGLLLADSRVDAAEIARTNIRYDEVILSSCSSGWRPTEVRDIPLLGDDILGVPGAFLEAGAKSVLVSIPEAGDEAAAQFMRHYHESRVTGKTPIRSLQETQLAMLKEGKYEPYTWVGFAVYGCL